jgi:hypothetical protein
MYLLKMGRELENIIIPGIITKYNKELDKQEVLLLWAIKGNTNKTYLNKFLQGSQAQLRSIRGSYSENEGNIIGGKELSFMNSKPSNVFDGTQVVYGNTYKLSNIILVPHFKEKEEEEKYIFDSLAKMVKEKYPIPLEDTWKEDFLSFIKEFSLKELNLYGKLPYSKALYVDIKSENVGEALTLSYGKSEFIKYFKRAPMIKALWKMIDPKNRFNMKAWGPFLNEFGGKDEFIKINEFHQESLIYLFETFGSKAKDLIKLIKENDIDLYSISFKSAAISIAKGEKINEDLSLKAVKIVSEKISDIRFKNLAIGSLISRLGELNLKELTKKPTDLINELRGTQYNPEPGAKGMAYVAGELWLDINRYKDYERVYLASMPKILESSRAYPTVKGDLGGGYSWESMDMGNPRGWFVGLETNCCQHLHSAGSTCVKYAAQNPKTSGIFRVMKKGHTIAQSWFWINEETGDFVFDNIEILGSEIRDSIFNAYMQFIENELEPRKELFGYERVCVGLGYNDMEKLNSLEKVSNPSSLPNDNGTYSDASRQVLLKKFY